VGYQVNFKTSALKSLGKIPKEMQSRILEKASGLSIDPRPAGASMLTGPDRLWRIRIGDYRVVYLIDEQKRVIDIRIIAHRREIYRNF
jgi:mRNA interferase RelE/StbE